jgi:CHAT domain-containing protein
MKQVPLAPTPRTATDIIRILDQQPGVNSEIALRDLADESTPSAGTDALADFYLRRGLAAGRIGRAKQELDDLNKATEYLLQTFSPAGLNYRFLALAEERDGNYFRYLRYLTRSREVPPFQPRGLTAWTNARLAIGYASIGDVRAAQLALEKAVRVYGRWDATAPTDRAATFILAQAVLLDATGRHVEAEVVARKVIRLLVAYGAKTPWAPTLDEVHAFLARTLIRQRRLLEAESEAREASFGALAARGRYSPHTAWMLRSLVWVLLEQGRYREAETLARAVIEIFERTETAPDSLRFAAARADLARALELQGRDEDSLGVYEAIRAGLRRDPESLEQFFGGNVPYAELLVKMGRIDQGLEILGVALERSERLVGETHRETAEIRGSLAQAYAAKGNNRQALHEFREATVPLAAARDPLGDAEPTAASQRLVGILSSYIGLLAAIEGSPLAREAGIDPIAESFRVADIARAGAVQRAVGANAARAAARSPALAEVVRAQQEAKRQIRALYEELADVLSEPGDRANGKVAELSSRIEASRRLRDALTARIEKEFPTYAELIDPKPVTVEQARAMLRPGEALITTLVTRDRTFVWAMSQRGPIAFAAAPLGAKAIEETVATLRRALEHQARTLGDIPEFDVAAAHRLYRAILEPVRSGWQDARSLLVVANGPLGQLPLALLPTSPVTLPPESGMIFANYRQVPWLVRSHAVTMLPSVASLVVRTIPPGDRKRLSFVGFGDPYFSREQAALAGQELVKVSSMSDAPPSDVVALTTRAVPIRLRGLSSASSSSQLAKLPRLPETAQEIRDLAAVTNADPIRDVILGARANEKAVKTLDLTRYRVVTFATHGLVPGDLDGLTQPALALSAPDVAEVEGDGLLALDEILSLRLNADWVVLSACNTASGQGAGAEAVSGLGRAFFYAGARALLVTHWPVETTSARALTTDLFRRQQEDPGLDRAQALQQTMNSIIDRGLFVDATSGKPVFSYAHPIFWAPFALIGDGSR